jgi:hypothetical protein
MTDDIDEAADQLSVVRSGEALEAVPVTGVREDDAEAVLELTLPNGDSFTETFTKPPVWGANCELKTLLDAFGLGPGDVDGLEGEELPCDRDVTETGIEFEVDLDALAGADPATGGQASGW